MTTAELVQATVFYIQQVSPFLLLFLALAFADKLIEVVRYAIGAYTRFRG